MDTVDRPGHRRIARLAARQHGVVGRWQLWQLGLTRGAIEHRLATAQLHRVARGVYAVGHPRLTRHARWSAAVLAGGRPDGVLSHRSAAALWGIRRSAAGPIEVSVPGRSRRGPGDLTLHRVRSLDPLDRTERDGIPVTTVARTLLDLADVLPTYWLRRAVEEAERLRLFDLRALDDVRARSNGRHGRGRLASVLADWREEAMLTRSEHERRFLEVVRAAGLRAPAVNVLRSGLEVDAVWEPEQLVVELDTHGSHGGRAAFERDRERDAILQLAGYRVLRITDWRLQREPEAVIRTLAALLGRGGPRNPG